MKNLTRKQNILLKDMLQLSKKLSAAFDKEMKLRKENAASEKICEARNTYTRIMRDYLKIQDKLVKEIENAKRDRNI